MIKLYIKSTPAESQHKHYHHHLVFFLKHLTKQPKYLFVGFLIGSVIIFLSFFLVSSIQNLGSEKPPAFRRQLFSDWEYKGEIKNVLTASLAKTDEGAKIAVERENSKLEFNLPIQNVQLSSEKGQGIYTSPDKIIQARYQMTGNGIKEEIILNKIPTTNTFAIPLKIENAIIKVTPEGIPVFFAAKTGEYLFHFERPFVKDGTGKIFYGVKYYLQSVSQNAQTQLLTNNNDSLQSLDQPFTKRDGKYVSQTLLGDPQESKINNPRSSYLLILEIDKNWLHDPKRTAPIIIDPTVTHNTTAQFATGTLNRLTDTGSGASPSLESYYHETATDINTVGLWHINETANGTCSGSKDVCDSSGNGNNGTVTGTTITTSGKKLGAAARIFNGTTDIISVPDASNLEINSAITVEAWVNTADTVSQFIEKTGTGRYAYSFQISGGYPYFIIGGTAASGSYIGRCACTINIADGQWHHLVGTYNGNNSDTGIDIYVDGVVLDSSNFSATPFTPRGDTDGPLVIGGVTGAYFAGTIDEVRISNIVRSPEEIKQDAARFPYSVYTSPVVDLTAVNSWTNLTWLAKGVRTGDGETPISQTSLIAQWNFNETSGTGANNDAEGTSCGGTPANCDGTLTGFASTASQDQAAGTGWTANNKRWGAGALMFDGSNDEVTITGSAFTVGTGNRTNEAWVKTTLSGSYSVFNSRGTGGTALNSFFVVSGKVRFNIRDDSSNEISGGTFDSNLSVNDGNWHHIVGVWDTDNNAAYIYIDGKLDKSSTGLTAIGTVTDNSAKAIGSSAVSTLYFNGVIDSTRIYSRALTAGEILANYQAGNIEFQTRTSADSSTWEAWKPVTGETAIDSMDGPYQYNTTDTGLVSYWPMDETSGTNVADVKGTNTGTATGTTIVDGKFGKARSFNGSSDLVNAGTDASLDISDNLTIEGWVKPNVLTLTAILDMAQEATTIENYGALILNSSGPLYFQWNNSGWQNCQGSNGFFAVGQWTHFVITYSGGTVKLYKNGILDTTCTGKPALVTNTSNVLKIGRYQVGSQGYFNGTIDEVRIYNSSVLSASTVYQHWLEGINNLGAGSGRLSATYSATLKTEGVASQQITIGASTVDTSLRGLWHFEETSGNANDSSGNGNTLTAANSPGVTDGFYGKVRTFNGTTQYFSCSDASCGGATKLDPDPSSVTGWTYGGWFYQDTNAQWYPFTKSASGPVGFMLVVNASGQIRAEAGNSACNNDSGLGYQSTTLPLKKWTHLVVTLSAANPGVVKIYKDGSNFYTSGSTAYYCNTAGAFTIGGENATAYFNGKIDEAFVYARTLSDEEIAEMYRAGRDHRFGKTITSVDLSSKNKLPFYVAADRPGTFLEATVGESAFANYEPDANTVGLWHLEEQTGSGAYIKDSSGYGNNGTPTGPPTFIQGKIGKARDFSGTNNISVSDANSLDLSTAMTIDAWLKADTYGASGNPTVVAKADSGGGQRSYLLIFNTSGAVSFGLSTDGSNFSYLTTSATLPTGQWSHLTATWDGTTRKIYFNGAEVASGSFSGTLYNGSGTVWLNDGTSMSELFDGSMDEIRISNVVRTADQIRQAYEVGKRTHPITIDFVSKPQAAYSSGTSVTILNPWGTTNLTDTLKVGDTIIFKENVGGTETIGQANVTAVANTSSTYGTVTVDSAPSFPAGGYTTNATVFKWQREYFDLAGSLGTQRDATTRLTLRVTDGSQGANVWLDDFRSNSNYIYDNTPDSFDTSTGVGTYSSTSITSTLNRYFQYRVISSSWDTPVAPQLTSVSLNYTSNVAPSTPSLDLPLDTATGQSLTPVLKTTTTDANGDYLQYKITLCTNAGMTENCQTFDQTASQTGWSGQNTQGGTAYTSGTQGIYTVQTALSVATTYYWKSVAIDPGGTNTWSSTQGTAYSFTTNVAPNTPSLDLPANGATNQITLPVLKTTATDAESDYLKYKITLCTNAGMTENCQTFDQTASQTGWSGQNTQGGTAYTSGTQGVYTVQSALSVGTVYYWKSYAKDPGGSNTWSSTQGSAYSFSTNYAPNTPTLDLPLDTATNQLILPVLKTTTTDTELDFLRYKITLCTNAAMTQSCQTFDQTASQTGWSGQNAQTGTAYTSGTQATYTIQSDLSAATTYYWKSYAKDPTPGSNTWSATQGTAYSFTTTTAPTAPTTPYTQGQTNPTGVNTVTPAFSAIHNDPNTDSANYYRIQVNTLSNFNGTTMWDSGKTSMTTTANGARSPDITYAGTGLNFNGITYYWRIKFWDTKGAEGAYSATQQFSMETLYAPEPCTLVKEPNNNNIVINWTDPNTIEDNYYVERSVNGGAFSALATKSSGVITHTDSSISTHNTYQYRVRASSTGVYSAYCTTATLSIDIGSFNFGDLRMEGLKLYQIRNDRINIRCYSTLNDK